VGVRRIVRFRRTGGARRTIPAAPGVERIEDDVIVDIDVHHHDDHRRSTSRADACSDPR
jgi:hypothetical protein